MTTLGYTTKQSKIVRSYSSDQKKMGFQMDHIDIGGGQSEAFGKQVAKVVQKWMQKFPKNVSWFGEPGRSICKPTQTVCCRVIGLREGSVALNDGVHGSFSGVMQEKSTLNTETPRDVSGLSYLNVVPKTIFGPTCDGLDKLSEGLPVPKDIKVGDWLVFASMGAYSQVTRSQFNGMEGSKETVLEILRATILESGNSPSLVELQNGLADLAKKVSTKRPKGRKVPKKSPTFSQMRRMFTL